VRILKKGFVAWTRDISIDTEQPMVLEAALVPSLEFISDYDDRAGTWRFFSYLLGGAGAAGLGLGSYLYFGYNNRRASAYNADVAAAGCSADATGAARVDCQAQFGDLRSSIESVDIVSIIAAVVGTISLGVGTYMFLEGPTPGIYDQYKPDTGVAVGVRASPGGGGWVGVGAGF
jgi:hypothetical protein